MEGAEVINTSYHDDDDDDDQQQSLLGKKGGRGGSDNETEDPSLDIEGVVGEFPKNWSKAQILFSVRRMVVSEYFALSCYWFGWSFLWLPLLVVIIPSQVMHLAGDEGKGAAMGTSLLLGSLVSLFAAPVFGLFSDSSTSRFGRRRPFMIIGVVVGSFALFGMAVSPNLQFFSFSFLVLSVANNMILSPYSALVPDYVPIDQRGIASGWLGGMSMLGYMCGGVVSYHLTSTGLFGAYMVLILVHGVCMAITCFNVTEFPFVPIGGPDTGAKKQGFYEVMLAIRKPMLSNDFRIVFITRFLMQMGILTVQEYLQFYLKDAIGPEYVLSGMKVADSPEKAVSLLFLPVLLGAFVSSLASGWISDHNGGKRKIIVYVSGALMASSCVLFSVTRSYAFDMWLGLIFGIGFGAFSVMDWALATDVLPCQDEMAKDMGIWSLALVLPQVVAAPIAGYLLDYFQRIGPNDYNLGYSVIFLLAVVYFSAGTYFVRYIHNVE